MPGINTLNIYAGKFPLLSNKTGFDDFGSSIFEDRHDSDDFGSSMFDDSELMNDDVGDQDLFEILDTCIPEINLDWIKCAGVCTGGAYSMPNCYGLKCP
ncbi:hypothetical protein CEXT_311491 [Caerostris extrusa]|uniref:Uncharacterized protein n=1 Tax=Caerostris extrusa TaxID=172846 RepID=A0AAV4W8K7_CAEEX|nr:hypothetical protein CEXT_311491 [Caerostris extrusa]